MSASSRVTRGSSPSAKTKRRKAAQISGVSARATRSWTRSEKRRRLLGRVRPRQPATHTDPWQVALEGLHELGVAKAHLGVDDRRRLEIACEALRRLAWGPDG